MTKVATSMESVNTSLFQRSIENRIFKKYDDTTYDTHFENIFNFASQPFCIRDATEQKMYNIQYDKLDTYNAADVKSRKHFQDKKNSGWISYG